MDIFLNCYVIGEGYTLKSAKWPGSPALTQVGRSALPSQTGRAFTRDLALLFWGELDGRRTGFVRDIPTATKDENGRACFLHAVFSGEGPEDGAVDALMAFAFDCPSRFMAAMAGAIVYDGADYRLDGDAFDTLCRRAADHIPRGAAAGALVPRTTAGAFWVSCGLTAPPAGAPQAVSSEEWKRREFPMDVFFYCSTPSSGFVLRRIDPATGGTLAEGKNAYAGLLPSAQKILTHGGANMAVFRENGQECLVAKDLKSTKLDQYGRRKTLSLVIQTAQKDALLPAQMGAWALLDHAAFADQATACVEVYYGPECYDVLPGPLGELLDRFRERIFLPQGSRYRDVWERIVSAPEYMPYRMMAEEATLEYFCRVSEIPLSAEQVSCLVDRETADGYAAAPLGLVFDRSLYVPGPTPEPVPQPKPETVPTPTPTPQPKPVPQPQPKPVPEPGPQVKTDEDEERLDLLKTKWFLPGVIGAVAVITGALILWLHFRGQ